MTERLPCGGLAKTNDDGPVPKRYRVANSPSHAAVHGLLQRHGANVERAGTAGKTAGAALEPLDHAARECQGLGGR
jgi:hypothetical protein